VTSCGCARLLFGRDEGGVQGRDDGSIDVTTRENQAWVRLGLGFRGVREPGLICAGDEMSEGVDWRRKSSIA
jgi:hypothetical protein